MASVFLETQGMGVEPLDGKIADAWPLATIAGILVHWLAYLLPTGFMSGLQRLIDG